MRVTLRRSRSWRGPPAGGATGEGPRGGFRGASREGIGSPRAAAAPVRAAIAEPPRAFEEPRAVVAEPRGVEGGPDDGEKSGGGEPDGGDPGASKDDEFYAQSGRRSARCARTTRSSSRSRCRGGSTARTSVWWTTRIRAGTSAGTSSPAASRSISGATASHRRRGAFCKAEVNVSRIWSPLGSNGARSMLREVEHQGAGSASRRSHRGRALRRGLRGQTPDKRGFIYQHTITDLDWDVAQMRGRIAALSNVLGQRVREPQLGGAGSGFETTPRRDGCAETPPPPRSRL